MGRRSREFDDYIHASQPFARPILSKLRDLFHRAYPDIEETMKWSFPHFSYRGVVGSMAGFKNHVRFGFWKEKLLSDPHGLFSKTGDSSTEMTKFTDISQLPPDKVLLEYIREAVALNEQGVKAPKAAKKPRPKEVEVPDDLLAALKKNKKALAAFDAFSPSHKREYIEWLTEAKQEDTRKKRLATAVEWIAEGKSRHWKYQRK